MIAKCHFEEYFGDEIYHGKIMCILDAYLNERQKENIKLQSLLR